MGENKNNSTYVQACYNEFNQAIDFIYDKIGDEAFFQFAERFDNIT